MEPISTTITALGLINDFSKLIKNNLKNFLSPSKDEFINYDLNFLNTIYEDEIKIEKHIPYAEYINFLTEGKDGIYLKILHQPFQLEKGKEEWEISKIAGFTKLRESGRIPFNETTIRLNAITKENKSITLEIQPAKYYDQALSNLIIDYPNKKQKTEAIQYMPLRNFLRFEYEKKLPPLSDLKLANTIGLAALIFYQDQGKWIPYLLKRRKKLGVFPGTIQCSASGVAIWPPDGSLNFDQFFSAHMYSEIKEEIGLDKENIHNFKPVCLCREFARAGKPQLIFMATTDLNRTELLEKRKKASRILTNKKELKEIEEDYFFNNAEVLFKEDLIDEKIFKSNVSHEAILAFHYASQYLQKI